MKLWGRANSSNVAKVLWAVEELGLPCDRVDVGGPFGGTDTPAYGALNPNRRIPTLEDGAFVLWESNAIVRYLAAKHGMGTLWPDSLEARASADRWMDWATTTVAPAIDTLRAAYRRPEPDREPLKVEAALTAAAAVWAIAEEALDDQPYLVGRHLTMADIALGPLLHRWHLVPFERPALPLVSAWYRRLCDRPAFARTITACVA